QGLISAATSGKTLNVQPSSLTNMGTLEAINGSTLKLAGSWSNTGTVRETASTLTLAGSFTAASLNPPGFSLTGGTVNLTGTLDNTGNNLALDDTLGSWTVTGGTIKGGTLSTSGSARFKLNSA